jgi:Electron transfer DM13
MDTMTCSTSAEPKQTASAMHYSTRRRGTIAAAAIAVVASGWYLFRPELLFIDKSVNESFRTAGASRMTGTGLGKAADATDNETMKTAGHVDLGSLKGNIGYQNYEIPAGVDSAAYNTVAIWCNRFSVNFGTPPLTMD